MNITYSLIILAAIMLSSFLVFSTATTTTTTIPTMNVFADSDEYQKGTLFSDYSSDNENGYLPMMNNYYEDGSPNVEPFTPERYGGYYSHYESEFYLDQYNDGSPYSDGDPYRDGNPYSSIN
ncbi:MAG TPA: hypothetical protein VFV86_08625 [Nitrososphaeraceae archaeon]|nr:hypothetical protein [Nitrososphaeraceae archaeon]